MLFKKKYEMSVAFISILFKEIKYLTSSKLPDPQA